MDNVIKELKLQLGEKEVSLTIEEAKKLKAALDELFGKEVVKEIHHHDYWQWWPNWPQVTYLTSSLPNPPGGWQIATNYGTTNGCNASFDSQSNAMTLKVA